tara:strand:+ start:1010 stop:1153 length:144 start_codon:yes stop_codon:yes gene_type:complete
MSTTQISNQIADLDFWLKHNQNHPDYCLKHQKRENLKKQLIKPKIKL